MATTVQIHTPRAMPKREEYIASVVRLIAEMKTGREMFSLTDRDGAPEWWLTGSVKPNRVAIYAARAAIKRGAVIPNHRGRYILAPGVTA